MIPILLFVRRSPDRENASALRPKHSHVSNQQTPSRPLGQALRANPFPKVTDLFCRLPLSTLFYQLEAAHLGDLMRL
jgi:hypothetical protein